MATESDRQIAELAVSEFDVAQENVDACLSELESRPDLSIVTLLVEKRFLGSDAVARLKLMQAKQSDSPISFAQVLPDTPKVPWDKPPPKKPRPSTATLRAFDDDDLLESVAAAPTPAAAPPTPAVAVKPAPPTPAAAVVAQPVPPPEPPPPPPPQETPAPDLEETGATPHQGHGPFQFRARTDSTVKKTRSSGRLQPVTGDKRVSAPRDDAESLPEIEVEPQPVHAPAPPAEPAPSAFVPGQSDWYRDPQAVDMLHDMIDRARKMGASDIHFGVDIPVMARMAGVLQPLTDGTLSPEHTKALICAVLEEEAYVRFLAKRDMDLCYAPREGGRMRTNIVKQRKGCDMVMRLVGVSIPTLEELGLPEHLEKLTTYPQGLVLCTGPMGCGKTTTAVALLELVNQNRPEHMITVEDPVEYIFEPKVCHISQREVGRHTQAFSAALRAALREDPDVIFIGEMRDLETTEMAISAAETGHLVFATLHTNNATRTIDRILDIFPVDKQGQVRSMVSESLRGVVSQQLIPRADGKGVVAAYEILINTRGIANIIREGKTEQLFSAIQLGKGVGMCLMDESIARLAQDKVIAGQEAYVRAENKTPFQQFAPK